MDMTGDKKTQAKNVCTLCASLLTSVLAHALNYSYQNIILNIQLNQHKSSRVLREVHIIS